MSPWNRAARFGSLDQLKPQATAKRLVGRLETLGLEVTLQPKVAAPA